MGRGHCYEEWIAQTIAVIPGNRDVRITDRLPWCSRVITQVTLAARDFFRKLDLQPNCTFQTAPRVL